MAIALERQVINTILATMNTSDMAIVCLGLSLGVAYG